MNHSNFFLDAQKVGTLPADNPVIWRSDAMLKEVGPLDRDITGGYLQGGPAGNLKMTHPTAFSIALLAWGLIQFPTVRPHHLLFGFLCSNPFLITASASLAPVCSCTFVPHSSNHA